MNLFEIDAAIEKTFDAETGEILDEKALTELEMSRTEKLTNIVHYIKNLDADAEVLKKAEDDFKARRTSCERKAESLRKYLETYLQGETFESEDKTAKVSYRKSEQVEVDDIWKLPEFLKKYKDPEADKTAIKKWLKEGNELEGARIVTKMNMQVR
jgi:hypothetical protein